MLALQAILEAATVDKEEEDLYYADDMPWGVEHLTPQPVDNPYEILDSLIEKQRGYRQDPEKEIPTNRERCLKLYETMVIMVSH